MEKILKTNSGEIHYWMSSDCDENRTTLFFLPGLTATHDLFINQIGFFSQEYNVLTWDAPAHGASRPYQGFTYEKAASAAMMILQENGIKDAVFIGQSLGGFIAQSIIKRSPDLVKGFVAIDTTPYGKLYYSKSDMWWLQQIEWMAKLYPDKMLRKAIAKQCTTKERSYQNMMQMLSVYEKNELCHLMGIGEAGFLEDNCDLIISCPIMLIAGEKDRTGKVKHYNKAWSKQIGVPITWITDAAHNANDDQPEQVNRAIMDFLKANHF